LIRHFTIFMGPCNMPTEALRIILCAVILVTYVGIFIE